jgi:alanine dehydrogenase
MLVGVPKEVKDNEYRVGLVPTTVSELVARGHRVIVEVNAGQGAGVPDDEYAAAGADIVPDAETVFERAELVVKVKEPLKEERKRLRRGQILFTYLHLAPDREQTEALIASGVTAIAYETVTDAAGRLPLLTPMSEIAGRMAPQIGAHLLEKTSGGRGILLGGAPGVTPGEVLILGSGVVATNAALIAVGMGADVTVVGRNPDSLRRLGELFRVHTAFSTREAIEGLCRRADLVIGTAMSRGGRAPKLIGAQTVKAMKAGAVIIDVSIDQGGVADTSRPTSHSKPTFVVDGVIHYAVPNMPGAVPRTSTFALNNATLPYVLALADRGLAAMAEDRGLLEGLNVHAGRVTYRAVADALGLPHVPAKEALKV